MTDVKGKWALVTGANRGIGYRIAKFMASKGCNLILHSRSLEHTKAVLDEVALREPQGPHRSNNDRRKRKMGACNRRKPWNWI